MKEKFLKDKWKRENGMFNYAFRCLHIFIRILHTFYRKHLWYNMIDCFKCHSMALTGFLWEGAINLILANGWVVFVARTLLTVVDDFYMCVGGGILKIFCISLHILGAKLYTPGRCWKVGYIWIMADSINFLVLVMSFFLRKWYYQSLCCGFLYCGVGLWHLVCHRYGGRICVLLFFSVAIGLFHLCRNYCSLCRVQHISLLLLLALTWV